MTEQRVIENVRSENKHDLWWPFVDSIKRAKASHGLKTKQQHFVIFPQEDSAKFLNCRWWTILYANCALPNRKIAARKCMRVNDTHTRLYRNVGGNSWTAQIKIYWFHFRTPWAHANPSWIYRQARCEGRQHIYLYVIGKSQKTIIYYQIYRFSMQVRSAASNRLKQDERRTCRVDAFAHRLIIAQWHIIRFKCFISIGHYESHSLF